MSLIARRADDTRPCARIDLLDGEDDCHYRLCPAYRDENGEDNPEVEYCPHLRVERVCRVHGGPWPCDEGGVTR